MDVLITAGPTREPIDPVRYIGNRSSGRMGAALVSGALAAGHRVTVILGPVAFAFPAGVRRIDVETAAQMHDAVLREFPSHDLLIMAAAVADYRPIHVHSDKLGREGALTIECEATPDIVATAAKIKRPGQRIIGFSLESEGNLARARQKLARKNLDLIVYNPVGTMNSEEVEATLIWPDGREEPLPRQSKMQFAQTLLNERGAAP
ncbi:MAG TPA: phosphopantothenoylcysteine decarboxylase [Tepidisphaeraceae bacterium]|jgi:phosphopantothenoylcysteine decarboxylase/phosphopantothenate--cysteine ligase|nr:phosphopantothenoylcysteine decarboxylase [Tepidisphaeraceae bacterium]